MLHSTSITSLPVCSTTALKAAVLKRPRARRSRLNEYVNSALSSEELIDALKQKSISSFEDGIASAMIVRELRRRVDAGAMGPEVNWYVWGKENLRLGKTRLKEHLQVANADDPRAMLKKLRKAAQDRVDRLEAKERADGDHGVNVRAAMVDFAKNAAIEKVLRIYEFRKQMYR